MIVNGEAYTNADTIFIEDGNKYYSSKDLITWTEINQIPTDASIKKAIDQYRIPITSQNGKIYIYMYSPGAREFSISRLSDRMKQLAQRLETKFDFKEEDFNIGKILPSLKKWYSKNKIWLNEKELFMLKDKINNIYIKEIYLQ